MKKYWTKVLLKILSLPIYLSLIGLMIIEFLLIIFTMCILNLILCWIFDIEFKHPFMLSETCCKMLDNFFNNY